MSYDEQPDPLEEAYREYAKLEKKLAAKDAELARLRGVVEEAVDVVRRAGRRPDGTAWANLNINELAARVASLPSPAEAGEKPCKTCGQKMHSDKADPDEVCEKDAAGWCATHTRDSSECPPAAPSDAKPKRAGEG
jgi:hypothetical protein